MLNETKWTGKKTVIKMLNAYRGEAADEGRDEYVYLMDFNGLSFHRFLRDKKLLFYQKKISLDT